jgi:hypothetical protein
MINSVSNYLIITLKFIKFSKPEKTFPPKNQVEGGYPHLNHLRGLIPPDGNPAIYNA